MGADRAQWAVPDRGAVLLQSHQAGSGGVQMRGTVRGLSVPDCVRARAPGHPNGFLVGGVPGGHGLPDLGLHLPSRPHRLLHLHQGLL